MMNVADILGERGIENVLGKQYVYEDAKAKYEQAKRSLPSKMTILKELEDKLHANPVFKAVRSLMEESKRLEEELKADGLEPIKSPEIRAYDNAIKMASSDKEYQELRHQVNELRKETTHLHNIIQDTKEMVEKVHEKDLMMEKRIGSARYPANVKKALEAQQQSLDKMKRIAYYADKNGIPIDDMAPQLKREAQRLKDIEKAVKRWE